MRRALIVVGIVALAVVINLAARPAAPRPVHVPPPAAAAGTALERGRLVFAKYGCAACHGAEGKGGFANPNAETDGKVPAVTYVAEGFTRAELRKKVLDGLATVGKKDPEGQRPPFRMPGWRGVMTDAEVSDLVEFLFSLYPKTETQSWR